LNTAILALVLLSAGPGRSGRRPSRIDLRASRSRDELWQQISAPTPPASIAQLDRTVERIQMASERLERIAASRGGSACAS
jgi:hypothetical protein